MFKLAEREAAAGSVRHGYEKPAGYTDTDTTDTDTDDHFCIRGQIRIHIHDIRTRRGGYLLPISDIFA